MYIYNFKVFLFKYYYPINIFLYINNSNISLILVFSVGKQCVCDGNFSHIILPLDNDKRLFLCVSQQ